MEIRSRTIFLRVLTAAVLMAPAAGAMTGCASGDPKAVPEGGMSGRSDASSAVPDDAVPPSDAMGPQASSEGSEADNPANPDQPALDDHGQPDNPPDNPPPAGLPGLDPRIAIGVTAGGEGGGIIHRISAIDVGKGLSLSGPATTTGTVGETDDANVAQQCNTNSTLDKGARVAAKIRIRRGKYVEGVAIGCKGITKLESPQEGAEMVSSVGDNVPDVTVPLGFALSGFSVKTCLTGGDDAVSVLIPMAKRVETWGVNDDIEWVGPKVMGWAGGAGGIGCRWTELRCPNGTVLSGLKTGTDEAVDGEPFLGALAGICNPLKNDLVSKPVILSADLLDYERIEFEGLKEGEQTCSTKCPDGYFVSGMRFGRSHEFDDGTRGVTGAMLLCKNIDKPADPVAIDLYETQRTCGGDLYEYEDYSQKFSSRITFFPGFAAHAIRLRTGKQAAFDQIRAMGFDQTPVDLTRQAHPVWVGAYGSYPSAIAGNGPGTEQVLGCPSNKILTAVEFRTGPTLKITGVKSYTCAGVKAEVQ